MTNYKLICDITAQIDLIGYQMSESNELSYQDSLKALCGIPSNAQYVYHFLERIGEMALSEYAEQTRIDDYSDRLIGFNLSMNTDEIPLQDVIGQYEAVFEMKNTLNQDEFNEVKGSLHDSVIHTMCEFEPIYENVPEMAFLHGSTLSFEFTLTNCTFKELTH